MSEPLLVGFVPAAAILIIASQLPVLLGVATRGKNELYRAGWALAHVNHWQTQAIVIAALVSGMLLLGKRAHPLFPAILLAVIGVTLYSELAAYEGATVGTVGASFPPLTTSLPLGKLPRLIVPALVIALVGFTPRPRRRRRGWSYSTPSLMLPLPFAKNLPSSQPAPR
jgi:SulP family sulfate permease